MIFLDSSFIVACKIKDDEHHKKSIDFLIKLIEESDELLITSDYIFDEVVTVIFGKTKHIEAAIDVGQTLKISASILKIDEEIFEKAWKIFKQQKEDYLRKKFQRVRENRIKKAQGHRK